LRRPCRCPSPPFSTREKPILSCTLYPPRSTNNFYFRRNFSSRLAASSHRILSPSSQVHVEKLNRINHG
jgi:hypothetical protein